MLTVSRTKQFKKDYRRVKRQGKDTEKIKTVETLVRTGKQLPIHFRDHILIGQYVGYRECHLEPNFLLIYRVADGNLTMVRVGSHAELFNE